MAKQTDPQGEQEKGEPDQGKLQKLLEEECKYVRWKNFPLSLFELLANKPPVPERGTAEFFERSLASYQIDIDKGTFLQQVLMLLHSIASDTAPRYGNLQRKQRTVVDSGYQTRQVDSVLIGLSRDSYSYSKGISVQQSDLPPITLQAQEVIFFERYIRQNQNMYYFQGLTPDQKKILEKESRQLLEEIVAFKEADLKNPDLHRRFVDNTFALYRAYALKGYHSGEVAELTALADRVESFVTTSSVGGKKVYEKPESIVDDINQILAAFRAREPDEFFDTFVTIDVDFKAAQERINVYLRSPDSPGREGGKTRDAVLEARARERAEGLYQETGTYVMAILPQGVTIDSGELKKITDALEGAKHAFEESLASADTRDAIGAVFQSYRASIETVRADAAKTMEKALRRKFPFSESANTEFQTVYARSESAYRQALDTIRSKQLRDSILPLEGKLSEVRIQFIDGQTSFGQAREALGKYDQTIRETIATDSARQQQLQHVEPEYKRVYNFVDTAYHHCSDQAVKQEYGRLLERIDQSWSELAQGTLALPDFRERLAVSLRTHDGLARKITTRAKEEASLRELFAKLRVTLQPVLDYPEDEIKQVASGLIGEGKALYDSYRIGEGSYQDVHAGIAKSLSDAQTIVDTLRLQQQRGSNYYDVLGLEPTATDEEIKARYRMLAFILHPDRSADKGQKVLDVANVFFKRISEAYQKLSEKK